MAIRLLLGQQLTLHHAMRPYGLSSSLIYYGTAKLSYATLCCSQFVLHIAYIRSQALAVPPLAGEQHTYLHIIIYNRRHLSWLDLTHAPSYLLYFIYTPCCAHQHSTCITLAGGTLCIPTLAGVRLYVLLQGIELQSIHRRPFPYHISSLAGEP